MTRNEFLNALRVPYNIDRHAAIAAFPHDPDGNDAWFAFVKEPHRFLMKCDDETFDRIWPAIEKRLGATFDCAAKQKRIAAWVTTCFGPEAMGREERIKRFLEEAIELVQADGIDRDFVLRTVDAVYRRPRGDPEQEVGGVGLTLLAWCEAAGLNAADLIVRECDRVRSFPPEHFRKRQREKSDLGLSAPMDRPEGAP